MEKTARETEISSVTRKLKEMVGVVQDKFQNLETRLTPVLRIIPESDGREKLAEPEFSTKLAQDINNEVRKLENTAQFIESLMSRLEL